MPAGVPSATAACACAQSQQANWWSAVMSISGRHLGALFGLLSRWAPWRIGKTTDRCGDCRICEEYCEGACRPSGTFIGGECVLCLNCLDRCPAGRVTFAGQPSATGEVPQFPHVRGVEVADSPMADQAVALQRIQVLGIIKIEVEQGPIVLAGSDDEHRFAAE